MRPVFDGDSGVLVWGLGMFVNLLAFGMGSTWILGDCLGGGDGVLNFQIAL